MIEGFVYLGCTDTNGETFVVGVGPRRLLDAIINRVFVRATKGRARADQIKKVK